MKPAVIKEPFGGVRSEAGRVSMVQSVLARRAAYIPYPGYSSIVPLVNDLRADPYGPHLGIEARILGPGSGDPVADAAVEIWHNSANSRKIGHRAKLFTDQKGYIHFITDMPARQKGKNYEIYARIVVNGECYYARLTFNHTTLYLRSRNREEDQQNTRRPVLKTYLGFYIQLNTSSY